MKKSLRTILIAFALVVAYMAGYGYGRWYGKGRGDADEKSGRKILYYVDPMHPWYKSDKPGIAPDCGMKLEPVYADGGASATAQPVHVEDATIIPAGALQISPERQQLIGIRYGEASFESSAQQFRSVGRVAVDETRTARVHARVEGWIEQVHADFVGQFIAKDQPLLTLYSPELLATQQELLMALEARNIMSRSTMDEARANSEALVEAARRRLELWNFNRNQINTVEKSAKPIPSVTIFAPAGGFITARNAFPGQKIAPDTELYAIADLGRVWIMADVFESDAPAVRLGLPALITSSNDPALRLEARVSYIQPQVDPATRTLKVRLEVNNPGYRLKPEMFVDVTFQVGGTKMLAVPSEAVLDAGTSQTVFIDRGNGVLEPRNVEVGRRFGDRVEILKGLSEGERIVVSGAFLLNSESQLKAAMAGMTHDPGSSGASTHKGGGHDQRDH